MRGGRLNMLVTLGLLLLCSSTAIYGQAPKKSVDLALEMAKLAREFDGALGVYAKELNGGKEFAYHADDLFATASLFKLPVMVELFRRVEAGEVSFAKRLKPPETGISRHGTGVIRSLKDQPEFTLRDYCRLMIIFSDNIATDTLMQIITPQSVTATMKELGFPHTRVSGNCTLMHYRMYGIESPVGSAENDQILVSRVIADRRVPAGFADRSLNGNVTTPREIGLLFERLYRGQVVSSSASAQMLEILKETTSRKMASSLPSVIEVAHKVGSTKGVSTDAGIIYMPKKPIVQSLFTYSETADARAGKLIADIGKLVAEEFP